MERTGDSFRRQKWFYTLVGAGGVSLLALSCILRFGELSLPATMLHLGGAIIVAAWAVMGFVSVDRRECEAREEEARARAQEQAEAQRAEAQRAQAEEQRATEQAIREVMARRTVSHGGMTINVHRTPSHGTGDTGARG